MKTKQDATIQEKQENHKEWLKRLNISNREGIVHELAERLKKAGCLNVSAAENGIVTAYIYKEGSNETIGLRGMYSKRSHKEDKPAAYLQGNSQLVILLTLVDVLLTNKDLLKTSVKFIFEPIGEAIPENLTLSLKESVFQETDVLYAASILPDKPKKQLFISEGPVFASLDYFDIHVQGQGGHAAYPNKTVDALIVAAQIIEELQLTVSRKVNPMVATDLTVTAFEAGEGTFNIIADSAEIKGNVRTLSDNERDLIEKTMTDIVRDVSSSHGAEGTLTYRRMTPILENDEALTQQVKKVFEEAFGEENVNTISSKLTADYFAKALEEKPGTVFYIGSGEEFSNEDIAPCNVITTGVQAFLTLTATQE